MLCLFSSSPYKSSATPAFCYPTNRNDARSPCKPLIPPVDASRMLAGHGLIAQASGPSSTLAQRELLLLTGFLVSTDTQSQLPCRLSQSLLWVESPTTVCYLFRSSHGFRQSPSSSFPQAVASHLSLHRRHLVPCFWFSHFSMVPLRPPCYMSNIVVSAVAMNADLPTLDKESPEALQILRSDPEDRDEDHVGSPLVHHAPFEDVEVLKARHDSQLF